MSSIELEIVLLQALCKYRPVGLHKHAKLIELTKYYNQQAADTKTIQQVKRLVDEYYDIDLLDQDDLSEHEFQLTDDFEALLMEKRIRPESVPSTPTTVRSNSPEPKKKPSRQRKKRK